MKYLHVKTGTLRKWEDIPVGDSYCMVYRDGTRSDPITKLPSAEEVA